MQEEYQDYGLILATEYGLPRGGAYIRDSLNKLIKQHDLPQIVFHSFRHMSVTYKLKLNGGDIKGGTGRFWSCTGRYGYRSIFAYHR